jgi:molybdopterin molybdotransferase
MITFTQALENIKKTSQCLSQVKDTELHQALNRFAGSDIYAPISMPPLPNSAMDGYAINATDWSAEKSFEISVVCAAGEPPKQIINNQAARIFTGAIIPKGANAVIPQELATEQNGKVTFHQTVEKNQFIRFIGEDFKQSDKLLSQGERISYAEILLLANAGISTLPTYQPLRIALLATGDEIIPLGTLWEAGKIFDSNRPCLQSILSQWGAEISFTKVIKDSYEDTKSTLLEAAQLCDIIITTGGVSVGDKDYIKPVLQEIGELTTWRVNIKPGKPIALGKVNDTPFIGLPGNPVSALSTLLLLARPLIQKAQGANQQHIDISPWKIRANFTYKTVERQDFLRARLVLPSNQELSQASIEIFDKQHSHIVSSIRWADGLVSIPANTTIQPNDLVEYFSFQQLIR